MRRFSWPFRDALFHVVTNAVAHGIENEEQRRASGKPVVGRLELNVERHGQNLRVVCRDDGRGIDTKVIRLAARKRALVSAAELEKMNDADVIRLLLKGGLSTAGAVTEVSGRGVGLDVLRETVEKLNGSVSLRTDLGRGTEIEIGVPISLASLSALLLQCEGETLALPLQAVRKTLRIRPDELLVSTGKTSVLVDGTALPFLPLATVLKRGGQKHLDRTWSAFVLESGNQRAVAGVEGFGGVANIVIRTLPPHIVADATVAGVALDSDGNPRLVLDPKGVIEVIRTDTGESVERTPGTPRAGADRRRLADHAHAGKKHSGIGRVSGGCRGVGARGRGEDAREPL